MVGAEKNLRQVGDRIEALIQELGALADPRAREKAEDVIRLLLELYGAGLTRILEMVAEAGEAAGGLCERFADDDLVASLLVLHGLHPLDVETRIRRALDRVRPYLGLDGGGVQLLGVQEGVARLRLEGCSQGCSSSQVTLKLAIERAIEEAAPEVTGIEVEGVTEPAPAARLLQIELLDVGRRPDRETGDLHATETLP